MPDRSRSGDRSRSTDRSPASVGRPTRGAQGLPTLRTASSSQPPASTAAANRFAFITLGVVALYLVVAFTVGVVFFGILPAMMSVRSKRAGEPLAPVAIAAAVISVGIAAATLR